MSKLLPSSTYDTVISCAVKFFSRNQSFGLTLCLLDNFECFLSSADLFKIIFFKKFFQEYHQCFKQFGSRTGQTFCRA